MGTGFDRTEGPMLTAQMLTTDMLVPAVVAFGIFILASAAQAVTGFGSALVAVPLLALIVDPVTAVVAMTVLSLLLTGVGFVKERGHVDLPAVRQFSLTGLIGMPLGLLALTALSAARLTLVMALVLAVLVVLLAVKVRLPTGPVARWVTGVTSGALLTSTGMNGPPLVVTMQAMGMPPRTFRATLQGIFLVQDVLGVIGFLLVGALVPDALLLAACGILAVPVGWWLGDKIFHGMSPEVFRKVVLAGLAITACVAAVKALG